MADGVDRTRSSLFRGKRGGGVGPHRHSADDIDGASKVPAHSHPFPEPTEYGAIERFFPRVGLLDTDRTNKLWSYWNEDDDVDRQLNLLVHAGDRTVDLAGNLTVEAHSYINQDLTTDSDVARFNILTVSTQIQDGPASSSLLLHSDYNNIMMETRFSVIIDLDLNASSDSQVFQITHDAQDQVLFQVIEDGDVDIFFGGLNMNSNPITGVSALEMVGDLDMGGFAINDAIIDGGSA
jgi:hypothetical protein